jgi:hypothetical protein
MPPGYRLHWWYLPLECSFQVIINLQNGILAGSWWETHDICQSMDDAIDSVFCQRARKLIPDILIVESIESVQAFLLFGLYILPFNPVGLSCTYFGIAIKLATQLNLRMKTTSAASSREFEVRKRVWWTAYALQLYIQTVGVIRNKLTFPRRTSTLHGRTVSICRADIGNDYPVDMEDLQPKERINAFQNTRAMLKLSIFMENAQEGMWVCPHPFWNLWVNQKVRVWWTMTEWYMEMLYKISCILENALAATGKVLPREPFAKISTYRSMPDASW